MTTYFEWTKELLDGFEGDYDRARNHLIYILEHNDFSNNTAGLKLNQTMLYCLRLLKEGIIV